ncbi:MAG TPA: class I SAM-dependent methyltransferase [Candidatus Acidoferrales bacterium]|jgi:ubiquinone/menaquinone biosynthesis C-methylase UbiE|nr:class I SAM-dependent methyltransferase [Candidatus Acidoferrum sp.]
MNYGYAILPNESNDLAVEREVPEFLPLQLYARVASAAANVDGTLADRDVIEIGSGRGGGAVHIAQRFGPRRMVALDFSSAATALARELHANAGAVVEFMQGDAEDLPFAAASFDVVLNVESAHCYGSLTRFLENVHRVLRRDGILAFADFVSRRNGARDRLLATLAEAPLQQLQVEDITANVVAALAQDETRKRALLDGRVKGWFKSFAQGAYAMEGSAMRREFVSGQTAYLLATLRKAG